MKIHRYVSQLKTFVLMETLKILVSQGKCTIIWNINHKKLENFQKILLLFIRHCCYLLEAQKIVG